MQYLIVMMSEDFSWDELSNFKFYFGGLIKIKNYLQRNIILLLLKFSKTI